MQLTGGQYRGRKIDVAHRARPTLAVVREGVFNVLGSYFGNLQNKKMLDMFLGSGIMSFEAVSRGLLVSAYDIDPLSIKSVRQNAAALGCEITIYRADCLRAINKLEDKFDVVYADPPWSFSYTEIFKNAAKILSPDGILIAECDKRKKPVILEELKSLGIMELLKEKNYGRCCLLFLKLS